MAENDKYRVLVNILTKIARLASPEELIEEILEQAVQFMEAERGYVFLQTPSGDIFKAAGVENIEGLKRYSSTIVNRVLSTGEAILTHDASKSPDLISDSVVLESIRSVIAAPLIVGQDVKGVIYLDSTTRTGLFTNRDLELLKAFAGVASLALSNATKFRELLESYEALRTDFELKSEFVGQSPKILEILNLIKKFAPSNLPVLITGESGTGKELAAKMLHKLSMRKGELVSVNCAAIPSDLLEAELFGYRKGAFTGATQAKKGLFEVADGGTLFLDEISELPIDLQAKLLRALQEHEIRPIGATKPIKVDVRIIAATNRDLKEEIKAGRFREDLYYRINVLRIDMPPLRERPEDIPLLVSHFIRKYGNGRIKGIERKAIIRLMRYHWPGNIRELENVIARAAVMASSELIRESDIQIEELKTTKVRRSSGRIKTLEEMEREYVLEVLERCGWNKSKAARMLGITLRGLQYKLKRWGVELEKRGDG